VKSDTAIAISTANENRDKEHFAMLNPRSIGNLPQIFSLSKFEKIYSIYRTLMTLIERIFADFNSFIRVNPPHPLYQRSIYYLSKAKILELT